MIKAIILDVDGVIVGHETGVNFPLPHVDVLKRLQTLREGGLPLILCSTKFGFIIKPIILKAKLNNPHIVDGGSLIIDPLHNKVIKKYTLKKETVAIYVQEAVKKRIYTELYTEDNYFVQKDTIDETFMKKRIPVLQCEPILVDSLGDVIERDEIIKIISFTLNAREAIEKITNAIKSDIHFVWSSNPYLAPYLPAIITAPSVSKAHASKEVVEALGLSFDEILGIGDSGSDWNFMTLCKYAATLQNGDSKIKELVQTKGEGNYLIGPSVNDNGILQILDYFLQK